MPQRRMTDEEMSAALSGQGANNSSEESTKEEDPGFLSTLVSDVSNIPGSIARTVAHPIDSTRNLIQAHLDQFSKAKQSLGRGDYAEAFSRGLAGLTPGGPTVQNAFDDIEGNKPGQGAARLFEMAAPFAGRLREIPGVPRVLDTGSAALKGGLQEALSPVRVYGGHGFPVPKFAAASAVGHYIGGKPGAVVGGMYPFLRGAYESGKDAWNSSRVIDPEVVSPSGGALGMQPRGVVYPSKALPPGDIPGDEGDISRPSIIVKRPTPGEPLPKRVVRKSKTTPKADED